LLLKLRQRCSVQHGAAVLKFMNMNVDQGRYLPVDGNRVKGPR